EDEDQLRLTPPEAGGARHPAVQESTPERGLLVFQVGLRSARPRPSGVHLAPEDRDPHTRFSTKAGCMAGVCPAPGEKRARSMTRGSKNGNRAAIVFSSVERSFPTSKRSSQARKNLTHWAHDERAAPLVGPRRAPLSSTGRRSLPMPQRAMQHATDAAEPFRVLVIDDDPGVRDYMEALVSRQGYRVFLAADAEQALSGLDDSRPDIVTLDVVLPGMDGLETLRRLKQRAPDVPVVMLSGHGQARNIVEAMRLGASDFLRKPFEVEELELAFQKALEK